MDKCARCAAAVLSVWCCCPWCGCQMRRRPHQQGFIDTQTSRSQEADAERKFDDLVCAFRNSKHERHSDTLCSEFLTFLRSRRTALTAATGRDVGIFLMMKNDTGSGRTVVHEIQCPYLGTEAASHCDCPVQMSHRTLESYRAKLETALGRLMGGQQFQNPATHWECRAALHEFKKSQLMRGVTTRVTKPAWATDVRRLSEEMFYTAGSAEDATERAVILHDRAFILDAFRTTLRGTQAGHTLVQQVIWLPNKDGLLFGYTWGKTLRNGSKQTFAVRRETDDVHLCLVTAVEDMMAAALTAGWNMSSGYLFRDLHTRQRLPWEQAPPLSAQKGTAILQRWLKRLGIAELSMHSLRAGGALYRHFEGEELEDIMLQAYWKSPATAERYLQVMRIAKVAGHDVLSETEYREWNELPLQELQLLVSLTS